MNVYVIGFNLGYSIKEGYFENVSGGEVAAVIKIEKESNDYKIVKYENDVETDDVNFFIRFFVIF